MCVITYQRLTKTKSLHITRIVGVVDSCLEFCRFETDDIRCFWIPGGSFVTRSHKTYTLQVMLFRSTRMRCAQRSNKWVRNF